MRYLLLFLSLPVCAAEYSAPAGIRPALRRPGAASILPGGRIISPLGRQFVTGPGPFGLAISASGKTLASANSGPDRFSLTVLEREKDGAWQVHQLVAPRKKKPRAGERESGKDEEWHSVFMGLAFANQHTVYASEGNSGRVRLVDLSTGGAKRIYELNREGFSDSFTGDLALDAERGVLYVLDQANFRLVAIDTHKQRVLSSVRLGRLPFAMALSPDKHTAYVTNVGMFEYRALPGVDPHDLRETGLPFPAFGFPSPESRDGARRDTGKGPVDVPGLGDPNVREANSLAVVDVSDPSAPKVVTFVRTGLAFGGGIDGGSSPSGVVATADRVFVSNAHNDSITVIDAKTNTIAGQIEIRIPGLENLRGVLPVGMAYDDATGWLLVAEAGINAIGVIDTRGPQPGKVLGHLPAAWFPSCVAIDRGTVYVTSVNGQGTGPDVWQSAFVASDAGAGLMGTHRRGSIGVFTLPDAAEVISGTRTVMENNGLIAREEMSGESPHSGALPGGVKHVVLIVKENRTFDEVFGDIQRTADGTPVMGAAAIARFGRAGRADGKGHRLSVQRVNVTPNHHALALRWTFSDNFYADSEVSVDGHHWLVGAYPDAWTETSFRASYADGRDFRFPTTAPGRFSFAEGNSSVHPEEQPEGGTIWHHLARHGITFRNYGEGFELAGGDEGPGYKPTGARFVINVPMPDPLYRNTSRDYPMFNMNIPDQYRASQFINEIQEKYVKGGEPFPQFIFIHLPDDHMTEPRPQDGYPYEASYVADNDYALGRIVEYLSQTPWWREMAIFVTEDDAQGGRDHIDAHRTVFMGIGPYFKRNYVSHVNTSFPGMLKTIFRLLGLPPLNLFDAVASDLSDCFTNTPDYDGYHVEKEDPRIFDPAAAREPLDPRPSITMDDPAEVVR
ncbi:MAG TPA: bifunctional YncE family protein/alkaline phosphatase family protein [Bryobacteraceae bacterium]|nr:bifunctional YncE family protein/alkaline phosphatase family protein [Bryobacteraceae bacterium]